MAKKKNENTLQYLQMPLPKGGKYSKMTKVSFGGLNKRYTIDSGDLTMEKNISTNEYPYLTPSSQRKAILSGYSTPLGMFAFDDFLIVIYFKNYEIKIDYIASEYDEDTGALEYKVYTSMLNADASTLDIYPRSIVQFNVYDTPTDPLTGKYVKKLLIFPDGKSMDFEITEDNFEVKDMKVLVKTYTNDEEPYLPPDSASHNYYYQNLSTEAKKADTLYGAAIYKWVDDESDSEKSGWKISIPPTMPGLKYATVHLSRVFGVDDDRVYASGFNDYTNWNLDTIDEYNESNSWCSPSQSKIGRAHV